MRQSIAPKELRCYFYRVQYYSYSFAPFIPIFTDQGQAISGFTLSLSQAAQLLQAAVRPIHVFSPTAIHAAAYRHLYSTVGIMIVSRDGPGLLNSCPSRDADSGARKMPVTPARSDAFS